MDNQIKNFTSVVSTLIALQILTLLVVAGGGTYLFRDLKQQLAAIPRNGGRPQVPEKFDDWQTLTHEYNATQGPANAEVVLIEFSDFQCPFCKQFTDGARSQLIAEYGNRVRRVFKHLPLSNIHPQAMGAAIAAQCAQREGKFWEAHDAFFARPDALTVDGLIATGESIGLSSRYADCVRNQETKDEVERDMQDATTVGLQGTPSFVVNGKVMFGAQSVSAFKAAFEQVGLKKR